MGKNSNKRAHPPQGAHKRGTYVNIDSFKLNPFRHTPSDEEMISAVTNFQTPYQWALKHASAGQQQFLNDVDRVEKITGWCKTAEKIDTLLKEAAPHAELAEELGLDPAKLWLYGQEEAPARLVYHLLKEQAENFHPFVLEEEIAATRAKEAIARVNEGISEHLRMDFAAAASSSRGP